MKSSLRQKNGELSRRSLRLNTVIPRHSLRFTRKLSKLKSLINTSNMLQNHSNRSTQAIAMKKIFDYYSKECFYEADFYNSKRLCKIIKQKLDDLSTNTNWSLDLSRYYLSTIFPRSSRYEYILLRKKINNTLLVPTENNFIMTICSKTPQYAFRNIMEFLGPLLY